MANAIVIIIIAIGVRKCKSQAMSLLSDVSMGSNPGPGLHQAPVISGPPPHFRGEANLPDSGFPNPLANAGKTETHMTLTGRRSHLPPGYVNVRGDVVDGRNLYLQRYIGGGTRYYSFNDPNGKPVFTRRQKDHGRRFVVIPDLRYPLGDGHYILLKKLVGFNAPGPLPQPVYQGFALEFRSSAFGYITPLNPNTYRAELEKQLDTGSQFRSVIG